MSAAPRIPVRNGKSAAIATLRAPPIVAIGIRGATSMFVRGATSEI
jgi:hypothetical protein